MSVVRLSEADIRARAARYEDDYPDFPSIFGDTEMPSCCKLDEVAARYGWGGATDAWGEYESLRWLLGDR